MVGLSFCFCVLFKHSAEYRIVFRGSIDTPGWLDMAWLACCEPVVLAR